MTLNYFLHLMLKRWGWFIVLPVITFLIVFLSFKKKPQEYATRMTLYTGLSSGISVDLTKDVTKPNLAYDNLTSILASDKTRDAVGLKLLVNAVTHDPKDKGTYISETTYNELMASMPDDLKSKINKESFAHTYKAFKVYLEKDDNNFIYKLLNNSNSNFSKAALSNIQARRIRTSDIIEVSYSATDPALCYQTLKLLREELITNYKELIKDQSNEVVRYYEQQLALVGKQLDGLENDYIDFNQQNGIINYSTQTANLLSQKLNLETESDHLKMLAGGNEKVIHEMEKKMGARNKNRLNSSQILLLRDQISKLSAQKALYASFGNDSTGNPGKENYLNSKIEKLRSQLSEVLDKMSFSSTTSEGVSMESILSIWFSNVVDYEQNKAQLPVLEERAKKIDEMVKVYAPLEPIVKKKEREISLAEKQYLEVLTNLNAAKLKDKNADITSGAIKVLDEPSFPFSPMPDKSKIMGLIAALAMVILLLAVFIATEFFDKTFSNPVRAERISGLKVKLLYPLLTDSNKKRKGSPDKEIYGRILTIELLRILNGSFPVKINLMSIYPGEGKSSLGECILKQLERLSDTYNDRRLHQDVEINELPALKNNFVDYELIKSASLNILVCRSSRVWSERDTEMVNSIISNTGFAPVILINGVSIDVFESYMGELPIPRSKMRLFIKKLISLDFKSTDSFHSEKKKA